jgi:hypothetical protein
MQIFHKHRKARFVRNIYGDEIVHSGFKRSIWLCDCGARFADTELHDEQAELKRLLAEVKAHDEDYDKRYGLVLQAIAEAHRLGHAAGFRIDASEPEWPVGYIELPTGQVSWHIPQHATPWDGHTTEEKYKRINEYVAAVSTWFS